MKTIPVHFVLDCDSYVDPKFGTGEWRRDEVRDVDVGTAAFLIFFADTWRDARAKGVRNRWPVKPRQAEEPKPTTKVRGLDEMPPIVPTHLLDRKGLEDYAMRHLGYRFGDDVKLDVMRARINAMVSETF